MMPLLFSVEEIPIFLLLWIQIFKLSLFCLQWCMKIDIASLGIIKFLLIAIKDVSGAHKDQVRLMHLQAQPGVAMKQSF